MECDLIISHEINQLKDIITEKDDQLNIIVQELYMNIIKWKLILNKIESKQTEVKCEEKDKIISLL